MSGEQQLERSVLERKERDELHAIAEAMSLRPGARTKKADIIDQILRATGIEVAPAAADEGAEAPKPRRRSRSRAAASGAADAVKEAAGDGDGAGADGGQGRTGDAVKGSDETSSSNGEGRAPVSSDPVAGASSLRMEEGVTSTNGSGDGTGDGAGDAQSRAARHEEGENRAQAGVADGHDARDGDSTSTASPSASARTTAPPSTSDGASEQAGAEQGGTDGSRSGDASPSTEASTGSPAGTSSGSSAPPADRGGDPEARSGTAARPERGDRAGQDGGRPDGGRGDAGRGGGSRQQGDGSQGRQNGGFSQGHHEATAEVGNRRSRRRRGRGGDRADREPQGGGQGQETAGQGEPVPVKGFLDLRDEGFGFLRTSGFLPSPRDVYVSIGQVRRFGLRKGDYIEGVSRPAASNEKYPALVQVETVSGMNPDEARQRPRFEDLTPLFPDERLKLEVPGDPANMTARIVDLISPIGKGQRGLIVSPPKAGKTTVLQQIAHSIEANNPEVHLMILLVEERPEEATAWRRSVKGEVVASTFDRPSDEHTAVSELTIERARRLVEQGRDVVIILDGITRLARAYNLAQPATGRIMSGGVDSGALYPPRKFFGAARNIEEGGSLTILATALVETGSRMDEVIFEEFKGTGNMELRLDRRLAERRIYPAIDVNGSSTRHEELLFNRTDLQQVWKLRRVLNGLSNDGSAAAGLELLMDKIKTTKSNQEFLAEIAKGPAPPV